MDKKIDSQDLMNDAFQVLHDTTPLTEQQKTKMMNLILLECHANKTTPVTKFKKMFITYPWRVAFIASTVQAIILTLIFGTSYTNLFLGLLGGNV